MKVTRSLLAVALVASAISCSKGNSKPAYQFKAAPAPGLAAKVGTTEITNKELTEGIESEIFEAESKLFELKFNRLKSLLLQKFMDSDARKKNMSNDEFLEKYIATDVKITQKEVDAFVKQQNIPAEHLNDQVMEKIKNYLAMERKKEAVDKWLAEQTKKTPVEVYIEKPRRPTFDVSVGNAPTFGSKTAKVTIVEFSDFQCPFCAKGADVLTELKKKYGDKIQVAFKQYPLPFHNHAEGAAVASLCANEQSSKLFWKMHDEMFKNQDSLSADGLKKLAKNVGLNSADFDKCMAENKYLAQVKADMEEGQKINVKSTPTFFINGQLIAGAQPLDVFTQLIDEELSK
jgi:protein-disulfide isomerase